VKPSRLNEVRAQSFGSVTSRQAAVGSLTGDSIRCFAEICLYRFVVGTDEPEPTTYRRAADHAVSGENVMIVETDSKHAEEWGEFLSAIPFVTVN
jgi:hypothetical protein